MCKLCHWVHTVTRLTCKQAVFVEVLKTQQQKKTIKHDQTDGGKWLFGEITLTNLIKGLHAKNKMQKKN